MAKHLARIHGTEEDKVNCPFYFKIGACRHSDRCSRLHHKPAFSPTILIKHLYRHPLRQAEMEQAALAKGATDGGSGSGSGSGMRGGGRDPAALIDPEQAQEDFFCFFEDLYVELSKFGRIDALHVCDNLGDHMIGHVYCKFRDEEEASDALQVMNGRYYDGRRMEVEFSPVTDFREARCRDYDEEACARGGFCNFLHVKPVPIPLIRSMEDDCEADRIREQENRRSKEREEKRSRKEHKKRKRDRKERKHSSDRHRSSRRHRSSSREHAGGGSAGSDRSDSESP